MGQALRKEKQVDKCTGTVILAWHRNSGAVIRDNVLSPLDLQIASHALSLDAVLITSDKAFRQVEGLRLENWTGVQKKAG